MTAKVLATMGERSVCPDSIGDKLAGVPDGVGAHLVDDDTVRLIFQSESYGPLQYETYGIPVNDGTAVIGGSHLQVSLQNNSLRYISCVLFKYINIQCLLCLQYIDYDRDLMSEFLDNDEPASSMVVGMGKMVQTMYNLKGESVCVTPNAAFVVSIFQSYFFTIVLCKCLGRSSKQRWSDHHRCSLLKY
jgi:hypothetical protein